MKIGGADLFCGSVQNRLAWEFKCLHFCSCCKQCLVTKGREISPLMQDSLQLKMQLQQFKEVNLSEVLHKDLTLLSRLCMHANYSKLKQGPGW